MLTGWIITAIILLPNLLFLVYPPNTIPPEPDEKSLSKKKKFEIIEKAGQVGCFVLPFFYSFQTKSTLDRISLTITIVALSLYYIGWIRYLSKGRLFYLLFSPMLHIPLPLAVAPIMAFLAAAMNFHSWLLGLAAVVLAAGHLVVSQIERERCL